MRGQAVLLRGAGIPAAADPVHATYGGKSIAIGAIERGEFHPKRVFKSQIDNQRAHRLFSRYGCVRGWKSLSAQLHKSRR